MGFKHSIWMEGDTGAPEGEGTHLREERPQEGNPVPQVKVGCQEVLRPHIFSHHNSCPLPLLWHLVHQGQRPKTESDKSPPWWGSRHNQRNVLERMCPWVVGWARPGVGWPGIPGLQAPSMLPPEGSGWPALSRENRVSCHQAPQSTPSTYTQGPTEASHTANPASAASLLAEPLALQEPAEPRRDFSATLGLASGQSAWC